MPSYDRQYATIIGVDVSKLWFDAAFDSAGEVRRFERRPIGYRRLLADITVKAGRTLLVGSLTGDASVDQVGAEIFAEILAVASGKKTRSEVFGYGDDEFVPWQVGAVL